MQATNEKASASAGDSIQGVSKLLRKKVTEINSQLASIQHDLDQKTKHDAFIELKMAKEELETDFKEFRDE